MKFLTLLLVFFVSTPIIAAECAPPVDKITEEKAVPAKKKHKKYKGTIIPSEVKKVEQKVAAPVVEAPAKKKHKKYEGTKIPDVKK